MAATLRLATLDDVEQLRGVIEASVRELSKGFYSEAQIEASLIDVFGVDTQLISDGTYFVAVEEAGSWIAGCGGWSRRGTLFGGDQTKAGRPDVLLDPAKDAARIRAFYVRPDRVRRGIGRQILRACKQAAVAEGFLRLELVATLPGVPLYEAMGFERIGSIEIPMRDGLTLPAVLMGKPVVRVSSP
jgi:GNAT superfamily N-acetyltransferase